MASDSQVEATLPMLPKIARFFNPDLERMQYCGCLICRYHIIMDLVTALQAAGWELKPPQEEVK